MAGPSAIAAVASREGGCQKVGQAGAGAIVGANLGGKDGAAKGGGYAWRRRDRVVPRTKGREGAPRTGADVTTRLTAPLTVRVSRS